MRMLCLTLAALSAGLYVLACSSSTYRLDFEPRKSVIGLELLLFGWLGPFEGRFGWYANPPFFAGWFSFTIGVLARCDRRPARIGLCLVAAALAIGSTALFARDYRVSGPHASADVAIVGYGVGLYAWFGSFLVLGAGCLAYEFAVG